MDSATRIGVFITYDNKLLFRKEKGATKYSIPSSTPEEDDNAWDTALRDTWLQTGITIQHKQILHDSKNWVVFVVNLDKEPVLESPVTECHFKWISMGKCETYLPKELKKLCKKQ